MPKLVKALNFILPEGLTSKQYHQLARKIVSSVANTSRQEAVASPSDYLVLSKLPGAPPEDVPVLNDSTWTLFVPATAGVDTEAVRAALGALPGTEGVEIESVADYKAGS